MRGLYFIDDIAVFPQEARCLDRLVLVVKFDAEGAFFKLTVVYDADIFDADIIAREDRRDGRDPSGFIDDIAVERELFLDRSGRAVRHGVAVIL